MAIHMHEGRKILTEPYDKHGHKASVQIPGTGKWICVARSPEIGSTEAMKAVDDGKV
jgi:hypothetical protein